MGRLLALPTNIRLGWKRFPGTFANSGRNFSKTRLQINQRWTEFRHRGHHSAGDGISGQHAGQLRRQGGHRSSHLDRRHQVRRHKRFYRSNFRHRKLTTGWVPKRLV